MDFAISGVVTIAQAEPSLTPQQSKSPSGWAMIGAAPVPVPGRRPKVAILREQGVNSQLEMAAANIEEPGPLTFLIASTMRIKAEDKQALLELLDPADPGVSNVLRGSGAAAQAAGQLGGLFGLPVPSMRPTPPTRSPSRCATACPLGRRPSAASASCPALS